MKEQKRKIMMILGRWNLVFSLTEKSNELQVSFTAPKYLASTIISQVCSCLDKGYRCLKKLAYYPTRKIWEYVKKEENYDSRRSLPLRSFYLCKSSTSSQRRLNFNT